jgi:ATP-dependent Lhr-like helicase
VLALIAQHGGITPERAWTVLGSPGGAFAIDKTTFIRVLRSMGDNELLIQSEDGLLLAGRVGDRIVNHYSFFAVFATPQEYRLVFDGHTLGTLPISYPVAPDQLIIFGGRRWVVLEVDDSSRTIQLKPSRGGKVPLFGGGGTRVHDEIRHEMRRIYAASDLPAYLDGVAITLLQEARQAFSDLHLDRTNVVQRGRSTYMMCWEGDRTVNTLQLLLASRGVPTERSGPILSTEKASSVEVERLILSAATGTLDLKHLATFAKNKVENKYDSFLAEDLLCLEYASRELGPVPESTCD